MKTLADLRIVAVGAAGREVFEKLVALRAAGAFGDTPANARAT